MAEDTPTPGAPTCATAIPSTVPLGDASNALASVQDALVLIATHVEGEGGVGSDPLAGAVHEARYVAQFAQNRVEEALAALMAYRNAQEGC